CVRIDPDAVYLKIEGIDDRDAAEALRRQFIYIDRENAVKLDPDTNFICDLIGCEATDDEGNYVGKLAEVLQNGACDVYVFRSQSREVMLPALKRVVLEVDVINKKILLSAGQMKQVAVFEDE
ncbi:MAG: ribosome maturation factor RimM, partial [Clostridia bacterium]|nr:ribosome maturation factor RimM [Clostridia bacterium]